MQFVNGTRCLLILFALLVPITATASHYPIDAVSFFEKTHVKAFKKMGWEDTKTVLNKLATPELRKEASAKLEVDTESLKRYAQLCDLLRIRGVGPKMAQVLFHAGYSSMAKLRKATPETLAKQMKKANQEHRVSEILPQEPTLENWIKQAKDFKDIVA